MKITVKTDDGIKYAFINKTFVEHSRDIERDQFIMDNDDDENIVMLHCVCRISELPKKWHDEILEGISISSIWQWISIYGIEPRPAPNHTINGNLFNLETSVNHNIVLCWVAAALLALTCLLFNSCKKDDQLRHIKRGQLVTLDQSMGKAVHGPYRVDSLYRSPGDLDGSNWYYITSNNGVYIKECGCDMYNCNDCTFTWIGPSKFIPNPPDGDSLWPRGDNPWGL